MSTVIYPSPIFGPIHSRRLGVSLGINLLPADGKRCSFDCIYCECGFNKDFRPHQPLPTREEVCAALEARLKDMQANGPVPDVLTFAGNGEPTLHPHFPEIMEDVRALRDRYFPKAKISVLSNSTQVFRPEVFEALKKVDNNILKLEPDGVMLAPTTATYTLPFVNTLNRLQIPYIYIDSYIQEAPALSFYGQNSAQSGYFAARMLSLLAGEQPQEIVIFRKINDGIVGSNQQERREVGFRKYMQQHHPRCLIWELNLHAKQDGEDRLMLDHFFERHPQVKNGITFNSKAYIIGEYLQERNQNDFHLIGYDLLKRNVECLKQGSIFFLIAQQPTLQGFNSIKTLCDHLILKKE